MLRLLLASEDGYLYVYSLDVNEGGDCALIRQFHLSNKDESHASSSPEAVKMEQQQLEATDQVDEAGGRKLSESEYLTYFMPWDLDQCCQFSILI